MWIMMVRLCWHCLCNWHQRDQFKSLKSARFAQSNSLRHLDIYLLSMARCRRVRLVGRELKLTFRALNFLDSRCLRLTSVHHICQEVLGNSNSEELEKIEPGMSTSVSGPTVWVGTPKSNSISDENTWIRNFDGVCSLSQRFWWSLMAGGWVRHHGKEGQKAQDRWKWARARSASADANRRASCRTGTRTHWWAACRSVVFTCHYSCADIGLTLSRCLDGVLPNARTLRKWAWDPCWDRWTLGKWTIGLFHNSELVRQGRPSLIDKVFAWFVCMLTMQHNNWQWSKQTHQ